MTNSILRSVSEGNIAFKMHQHAPTKHIDKIALINVKPFSNTDKHQQ